MAIRVLTPERVTDPRDVVLDRETIQNVRREGMSLSAWLEEVDGTERDDGMDAYERQLCRFNIRPNADPERGIPASTIDEFWSPKELDGRRDLHDDRWMSPRWSQRERDDVRFFQSNQPQSWALFPEYINRIIRANPLAEDTLDKMIALTTPIDSQSYQAIYLQDTIQSRQFARVPEATEIPRIFVKLGQQSVSVYKYGAAIVGTYEQARRIRLNIFTIWLNRVRQQLRLDMANQAAGVIVNGDGNSNSATNYIVSTLDSSAGAGPGTVTDPYLSRMGYAGATSTITKSLTYSAFLQWRTSLYPLGMTHIMGRLNELLQILQLQMPTINPTLLLGLLEQGGNIGLGKISLPADDLWGNVQLVYLPFAPGGMLIGYNKDSTLEMLLERGSDVMETDKNILEQTDIMTMTQTTGFDKILSMASTTLTFV